MVCEKVEKREAYKQKGGGILTGRSGCEREREGRKEEGLGLVRARLEAKEERESR